MKIIKLKDVPIREDYVLRLEKPLAYFFITYNKVDKTIALPQEYNFESHLNYIKEFSDFLRGKNMDYIPIFYSFLFDAGYKTITELKKVAHGLEVILTSLKSVGK